MHKWATAVHKRWESGEASCQWGETSRWTSLFTTMIMSLGSLEQLNNRVNQLRYKRMHKRMRGWWGGVVAVLPSYSMEKFVNPFCPTLFACRGSLYMSESDVLRHQILTSKDGTHTERIKIFIMTMHPCPIT